MRKGVYSTIIFDMDGVLVDSEPLHERAFLQVFAELGYADNHGIDFPAYYGSTDRAVWVDFIARHRPAQGLDELVELKQQRFFELLEREKPIYPEIPALVKELSGSYKLGVASGSRHVVIDRVLELGRLRRFFPVVVSVQDVPRPKPAPDVFLRTAELLGVPPGGCCVIEDSVFGIQAALEAGMQVIAITNSLPAERLTSATRVVRTFEEIQNYLLSVGC